MAGQRHRSIMSASQDSTSLTLTQLWSIEAVRLYESQRGPLADEVEWRRARAAHLPLPQAVALRADLLSQRLGWATQQQRFWRSLRVALSLLAVLAVLVGVGAAQAALGQAQTPVNLVQAFLVLLAIPTLGLVFWLLGLWFRWRRPATKATAGFHSFWCWLAAKLARGPDAALLMQALFMVLRQQRLGFWWASVGHHGFWLLVLGAAWLTLWGLLAFKRYVFQWETTLLAPEQFIQLAQWASSGLQYLGWAVPDAAIVRQSDGSLVLGARAHALWASWLLGCVAVYGFLPRLLAFGLSTWAGRHRQRRLAVDLQRPGLLELLPRFGLSAQPLGVDRPATQDQVPLRATAHAQGLQANQPTWVIGMELDPQWQPQVPLPASWHWYGVVDSRAERQQLLRQLQTQGLSQLLLVCDGQQTPDRGLMAWLVEVAGYAQQSVVLVNEAPLAAADTLRPAWAQRLEAAGLTMVYGGLSGLLEDLDA